MKERTSFVNKDLLEQIQKLFDINIDDIENKEVKVDVDETTDKNGVKTKKVTCKIEPKDSKLNEQYIKKCMTNTEKFLEKTLSDLKDTLSNVEKEDLKKLASEYSGIGQKLFNDILGCVKEKFENVNNKSIGTPEKIAPSTETCKDCTCETCKCGNCDYARCDCGNCDCENCNCETSCEENKKPLITAETIKNDIRRKFKEAQEKNHEKLVREEILDEISDKLYNIVDVKIETQQYASLTTDVDDENAGIGIRISEDEMSDIVSSAYRKDFSTSFDEKEVYKSVIRPVIDSICDEYGFSEGNHTIAETENVSITFRFYF